MSATVDSPMSKLVTWLRDYDCGDDIAHAQFDAAAAALSSQSLSLSEAREEIERLKAASLHHETGERITRKDLNNAHRKGAEEGRLAAHLIDGIPAERQRDEALEALRKIHNFGQSAEPDHWKFRCMARDAARTALENSKANLADANTNPPLSDLSSLRKGAECQTARNIAPRSASNLDPLMG